MAGLQDLNIGGGTFVQICPDGITRTFNQLGSHSFLNGCRDVLQNGLVGDGATDDSPALNVLANTTLQPKGGIIYFGVPGNSYLIGTNITLPGDIMLVIAPGVQISVANGIVMNIAGTIIAPGNESVFTGTGLVCFNSGCTRSKKTTVACSPTTSGSSIYLPKPGDASISIVVPEFSTVKSLRLVIVDAHPANGHLTTYAVTNGNASTTYIQQTQNSGDPATTVDFDAELTLPQATGNGATFILTATGTDTIQYRGWLEVEFY